jgi:hypothetical protein
VSGSLPAGTTTSADIADSTIDGNGNGVWALSVDGEGVVKASVRNSRVVRNTLAGMRAESVFSGTAVTISASNNIVSNNGHGLATAGTGSKVWASGNTVSDNDTGFLNSGGLFESAGNNAVRNNNSDTSGTITPIATK